MMIGLSYGFRAEKVTNSRTGSFALVISRRPRLSLLELEQSPPRCRRAAPDLEVRSGDRFTDREPRRAAGPRALQSRRPANCSTSMTLPTGSLTSDTVVEIVESTEDPSASRIVVGFDVHHRSKMLKRPTGVSTARSLGTRSRLDSLHFAYEAGDHVGRALDHRPRSQ
jgi:hypothetical protein